MNPGQKEKQAGKRTKKPPTVFLISYNGIMSKKNPLDSSGEDPRG